MPAMGQTGHGEDGFTLIELLVAMTVSLVVLFAVLQSFDLFTSNAAHQTRLTDANDQVRRTMDGTVRDLRGASQIVRADPADLVYTVPETAGVRTERICVQSGDLYGSTVTAAAVTIPTGPCSGGTRLAQLRSTASTAFTYDGAASSTTPALVKNVGLTLSLEATTGAKVGNSTLRASAARRSAGTLPITPGDIDPTCNSQGALLSLGVGLAGLGPLTVRYTNTAGVSLGTPTGTSLQISAGITIVVATVTDALGATTTVQRDVQCD